MAKTLHGSLSNIAELKELVDKSAPHDMLVKVLALAQSQTDHLNHIHKLLVEEHHLSPEEANTSQVSGVRTKLKSLEEKVRSVGQSLRESR